ncbi:MAG: protein translocase subunit SecD [Patescibacteria group bacterium]
MRFLTKLFRFIFVPEGERAKAAYVLLVILIAAFFAFALDFPNYVPRFWKIDFKLGLDLKGGAHLVYVADLSSMEKKDYAQAMSGLRDTIERRVNSFGIAEPNVQTAQVGDEQRLIVELAGVTDVNRAIAMIGETPFLEFKEERASEETQAILEAQKTGERTMEDPYFISTGLTGKYLERSELTFDQTSYKPVVNLNFDADGTKLFEEITTRNVGKRVAIYLDGVPVTVPVVNEPISAGQAVISGDFSVEEARTTVQRLNSGALPVPIQLISQQSMEASLGQIALEKSLKAGIYAIIAVGIFMIVWYRIPGVLAVIALLIYTIFALAIFKLLSVTLTLAGIVGFILSIGMAVDANILIFARMREEVRSGKRFALAVHDGFARAWPSIRDSNISTLITCFVLYFFTASLVKGFALTLAIGVLVSMFSAISVTRLLLKVSISEKFGKFKFLWYH